MKGADRAAVILAGGGGTRFWPLSTEERPKQFLDFGGGATLLQQSYRRLRLLLPPERILVLTAGGYVERVQEQLPELPSLNVIGEPERKDTAAAIALAALGVQTWWGCRTLAAVTADHLISPDEEFHRALEEAYRGAEQGAVYTFGIEPEYPATGFGYLELGARIPGGEFEHYHLRSFREKPDFETAERFCQSGRYLWNSGMFVWPIERLIEAFSEHLPGHLSALRPAVEGWGHDVFTERLEAAFPALERISVDYALLEKLGGLRAVKAPFQWADLGTWQSLKELLASDEGGNRVQGSAALYDCRENLVYTEVPEEELLLVGVEGLVVVRSGNRTLIASQDRLDELKYALEVRARSSR